MKNWSVNILLTTTDQKFKNHIDIYITTGQQPIFALYMIRNFHDWHMYDAMDMVYLSEL